MHYCGYVDNDLVKQQCCCLTDIALSCLLQVDPYHTLFGLAGLSLLGHSGIRSVDPVFCMPTDVIQRLGIKYQLL